MTNIFTKKSIIYALIIMLFVICAVVLLDINRINPTIIDELPQPSEDNFKRASLFPLPFDTKIPYDWTVLETTDAVVLQSKNDIDKQTQSLIFYKNSFASNAKLEDLIPNGSKAIKNANSVNIFCLKKECSIFKNGTETFYQVVQPENFDKGPLKMEIAYVFLHLKYK